MTVLDVSNNILQSKNIYELKADIIFILLFLVRWFFYSVISILFFL